MPLIKIADLAIFAFSAMIESVASYVPCPAQNYVHINKSSKKLEKKRTIRKRVDYRFDLDTVRKLP